MSQSNLIPAALVAALMVLFNASGISTEGGITSNISLIDSLATFSLTMLTTVGVVAWVLMGLNARLGGWKDLLG
jgi:hypothetical protein